MHNTPRGVVNRAMTASPRIRIAEKQPICLHVGQITVSPSLYPGQKIQAELEFRWIFKPPSYLLLLVSPACVLFCDIYCCFRSPELPETQSTKQNAVPHPPRYYRLSRSDCIGQRRDQELRPRPWVRPLGLGMTCLLLSPGRCQ